VRRSPQAAFLSYFDERRDKLRRAIDLARRYYAVEGVHDLRVEIKRMRVFYEVAFQLSSQFRASAHRQELRKVFRTAGRLRDIDIEQLLVGRALPDYAVDEYFIRLKCRELKHRPAFLRASSEFRFRSLAQARGELQRLLSEVSTQQLQLAIASTIRTSAAELRKLGIRRRQSAETLHELRKRAKALRYRLDIEKLCFGSNETATRTTAQLKALYDCLGAWRDLKLTQYNLRRFRKKNAQLTFSDSSAYGRFTRELSKHLVSQLDLFRLSWADLSRGLEQLTKEAVTTDEVRVTAL
jgi:CHAD domain-containing protein